MGFVLGELISAHETGQIFQLSDLTMASSPGCKDGQKRVAPLQCRFLNHHDPLPIRRHSNLKDPKLKELLC